jgi:hypothetical protein
MEETGIAKFGVTAKALQVLLYVAQNSSEEILDFELIMEDCQSDYWRIPSFTKLQSMSPSLRRRSPMSQ